jgi:hypothetical protein
MLKHPLLSALFVISIGANLATTSAAEEFATLNEAKAMLDRAIVAIKENKAAAIANFNHNDPRYRDRDLFVFCFDRKDGKFTAHEAMIGWDVRTLHDIWGSPFGEEMFAVKDGETIEVAYLSPVPGSTTLSPRGAYVTGIGEQACGVSAYQQNGQVVARNR